MNRHPPLEIVPGLCSVTFRQLEAAEIIDLAAAGDLRAIEWGADGHVPVGDLARAAAVAERAASAGIECASYGTYLGVDDTKGGAVEACETAVALGATNIRVWAPFGPDHTTSDAERADITAKVAEVADHAARHHLTVGLEFHGWTLTDTASSAARLVDDIGADHVFSYWQPNYWDPDVNESPQRQLAELRRVLPHLSNLHVYWWSHMDRRPLADGASTWRPALAAAQAVGRWCDRRYAFLEFVPDDDPKVLAREATTLNEWLESLEDATGTSA